MKRILTVVGLVLGLGAIGLTAAHAASSGPSTDCTHGEGGETRILGWPVALATEVNPTYNGGANALVCWSTTPEGSSAPEAAGGQFRVENYSSGPNDRALAVRCLGDRTGDTVVTVDCGNYVTLTDPTSAPGTTASTSFKIGTVGPVPVGQTGAEVGMPTGAPNEPGGGDGTGANLGTEVCTWVNRVPFCVGGPSGTTVTVAEDDLMPVVETAPSCVYLDGDCLVPTVSGARVTLFPDTTHDTLVIETPPDYDRTDVARTCIGVNYACP